MAQSAIEIREDIFRCIDVISRAKMQGVDANIVSNALTEFIQSAKCIELNEATAELYFCNKVLEIQKPVSWWKRFLTTRCPQMRGFYTMVKNYNSAKELFCEAETKPPSESTQLALSGAALATPRATDLTLTTLEQMATTFIHSADKTTHALIKRRLNEDRVLVEKLRQSWLCSRSNVPRRVFSLRKELHKLQDKFGKARTEGAMLTEENILMTLNKILAECDKEGKEWTPELVVLKENLTKSIEDSVEKRDAYNRSALILRDKEVATFRMTRPTVPACSRNTVGFGLSSLVLSDGQYVLPFDRNDVFRCMATSKLVEASEQLTVDAATRDGEGGLAPRFSAGTLNIVVVVNPLDKSDGNDKCFTGRLSQEELRQEFVIPGKKYVTWRYVRRIEFGALKEEYRARMRECERYLEMFETRPDLCNEALKEAMENSGLRHRLHVVTLFDEYLDVDEWGNAEQEWVINTIDDWAFKLNCFEPYGYNREHNHALHRKMQNLPSVVACTEMITFQDEWEKMCTAFQLVDDGMEKLDNTCMHLKTAVLVEHNWQLLAPSVIIVRQLLKEVENNWNKVMQQHLRTHPVLIRIIHAVEQDIYMKEFQTRLEPDTYSGEVRKLQAALKDVTLKHKGYKTWIKNKYEPMRVRVTNKIKPWNLAIDTFNPPVGLKKEKIMEVWRERQRSKGYPIDTDIDLKQLKFYAKNLCRKFKDVQGTDRVSKERRRLCAELLQFRQQLDLACVISDKFSELA